MNQKTAYFNAVVSVLKENKVEFVESETVCKDVFTKEMREQVIQIVMAGFKSQSIPLKDTPANKEKLADDSKLQDYAISTLNNWFLKDTRLNGGTPHEIKNKGSRAGQRDKTIRNFKALQATFEPGSEQYLIVQGKIDERQAQITAEKAKKSNTVDMSLISDELKEELGL